MKNSRIILLIFASFLILIGVFFLISPSTTGNVVLETKEDFLLYSYYNGNSIELREDLEFIPYEGSTYTISGGWVTFSNGMLKILNDGVINAISSQEEVTVIMKGRGEEVNLVSFGGEADLLVNGVIFSIYQDNYNFCRNGPGCWSYIENETFIGYGNISATSNSFTSYNNNNNGTIKISKDKISSIV
jgi:hypothetical protein